MAVDRGLGGLMVWSLDTDDFRGLCDAELDPYIDFQERYNELLANPQLSRALRSLGLPTAGSSKDHYFTSNGRLTLRLPQRTPDSNFNLLRTVDAAASLATQEKRILDAVATPTQANGVHDNAGTSGFRSDYTYNIRAGYWFKVHSVPADWHTARLQCHYEGAVLASPLNAELMKFLTATLSQAAAAEPQSKLYFSGVHQTFGDGVYTSVEGVPLENLHISKWNVDKRNNLHKGEQCLVYTTDGTVQDNSCKEKLPYLCYRKFCETDRLTDCGTIDKAYKLDASTGSCYKLHTSPATWDRALAACGAEGGHLAVVNSAPEAEVLTQLAASSGGTVVVGFRQWGPIDSWWTVLGGALESTGWAEWRFNRQHPQRSSSRQACGGFVEGKLDDIFCDVPYAFVCEKATSSLTKATGAGCQSPGGIPFLTC